MNKKQAINRLTNLRKQIAKDPIVISHPIGIALWSIIEQIYGNNANELGFLTSDCTPQKACTYVDEIVENIKAVGIPNQNHNILSSLSNWQIWGGIVAGVTLFVSVGFYLGLWRNDYISQEYKTQGEIYKDSLTSFRAFCQHPKTKSQNKTTDSSSNHKDTSLGE